MTRFRNFALIFFVLFFGNILLGLGTPWAMEFDNYDKDHVVAEVHGKRITVNDIIKFTQNQPAYYSYLHVPDGANNILNEMILREILYLEGQEMKIPQVSGESREHYIRKVLNRLFPKEPELTQKKLREFYEKHPEIFGTPLYIRLSQIRVYIKDPGQDEALKRIREAEKLLKKGTSFSEVAAKFSEDKFLKERKGDLGFLRADDIKPEELKERIIAMKKGQVSDIQKVGDYYAIFKVTDIREPVLEPFDPEYVREKALKYMAKQSLEKIRSRLSKKWGVKYPDPAFKPPK